MPELKEGVRKMMAEYLVDFCNGYMAEDTIELHPTRRVVERYLQTVFSKLYLPNEAQSAEKNFRETMNKNLLGMRDITNTFGVIDMVSNHEVCTWGIEYSGDADKAGEFVQKYILIQTLNEVKGQSDANWTVTELLGEIVKFTSEEKIRFVESLQERFKNMLANINATSVKKAA